MAKKKSTHGAQKASFIHLRVHSAYSLLEGAIKMPDLVELCLQSKMPAVAVTDTSNLFGALEFSKECAKAGVQPIVGCIVRVMETAAADAARTPETGQLLLIAQNSTGYQNLMKLVSRSFLCSRSSTEPAVTLEDIRPLSEGMIALTGGPRGLIGTALLSGKHNHADMLLQQLQALFPERLYIELMRHGTEEEQQTEKGFIDLAYAHTIPLVATNDVFFSHTGMYASHDALICIADGRYVTEENRRKFTPEHYFKTPQEMAQLFADIPEAIHNTLVIAQRCSIMAESRHPLLPHFSDDEEKELKTQAEEGLLRRLQQHVYTADMNAEEKEQKTKAYTDRLLYELGVINTMGFPGYFLIVSDFIRWSKSHGIPVGPGRGSGAGSVVAWALEITDLDPLRFGLLFERFLNPERISMPDFDVDFCQERRDEVIRYVQEKYGHDRVAQIITFGKLQARAVLRDVGRVLQMPYGQVDRICKMIPFNPLAPVTLSQAIAMDPELRSERDSDEQVATLLDTGLKLEGLYRHASTHAAGVVIGDRPLDELVPLYRDPRSDMPVTQYSMKYAEAAGLVKFDFLGLKTLTVIDRACHLIKATGKDIDIHHLPLDDKPTFDMLAAGKTTGVFQMESAGMRDALRKMRPDCIEDIIALISLYRPGPMENIPTYIARKHGKEAPDYLHPKLESVLKETFGVIIYQEQVMQIAQILAGYKLGDADLLRRAMGKKIKEEMDAQREMFMSGAEKNGVDKKQASDIFDLVAKFAGYGFNKSHAAAYAMIGYQTAYLKANYPVEFITASMNIDIGDTDKINIFREEALRAGITILPPDVNASGAYFTTETLPKSALIEGGRKRAIRYGLGALKNVGLTAMQELIQEREKNGTFRDVFDMAGRCSTKVLNKRQLESLAKSGAFDSLYPNRRQLFEGAGILCKHNQSIQEEKLSNQTNLFGSVSPEDAPTPLLPSCGDWDGKTRLEQEMDAIGFYLTAHPLDNYRTELQQCGITAASELEEKTPSSGAKVRLAGIATHITHRASAGKRFAYVQFSDPTGSLEISLFNEELIARSRDLLESKKPLLISADARKDEGGIRLMAENIEALDTFLEHRTYTLDVVLHSVKNLPSLKAFFSSQEKGRAEIALHVRTHNGMRVEIVLPEKLLISPEVQSQLSAMDGVAEVSEKYYH